jgi:hypothetical protein
MRIVSVLACVVGFLSVAAPAAACVCVDAPLEERLEQADVALIGKIVDVDLVEDDGVRRRFLRVEVDQRVKGDIGREIVVRSPAGSDCDLEAPQNEFVGLLLERSDDGAFEGNLCSRVDPGELVAIGGEPRGAPIKVGIGLVILVLILLWSFRRLARGTRPQLPGAPRR